MTQETDRNNRSKITSAAMYRPGRVRSGGRGSLIIVIAEKIRPTLAKMFENVRDKDGILLQPAHIRGIALNMAQSIVQEHETKVGA